MGALVGIAGYEFAIQWRGFYFFGVEWPLLVLLDSVRMLFISTVLIIAGGVIFFRKRYMQEDGQRVRFGGLVLRFVLCILVLIIRPNLVRLILG